MKKFTFQLILILLFSLNFNFAQTAKQKESIIKLNNLLSKAKDDTTKVNLYNKIFIKYYPYDVDKMHYYNKTILSLSKKINYNQGIGFFYLNQTDIDYLMGDKKNYIKNALKAKNILFKEKNKHYYLRSILYLSYSYLDNRKFIETNKLITQNLNLALKNKEYSILAQMYALLGNSYYNLKNTKEALTSYKNAIVFYDKSGKTLGKPTIYQDMSSIYFDLGLYDKALTYIDLCINLCNYEFDKYVSKINKINVLNHLGKYNEALKTGIECKQFFLKQKDVQQQLLTNSTLSICDSYVGLKNYEDAIKNGLLIIDKCTNKLEKADLLIILSESYLKLNKKNKAKKYIDEALTLTDSIPTDIQISIYKNKSQIEESIGNYNGALVYNKKQIALNQQNIYKTNQKEIQQLVVDFERSLKENKIKKLEVKNLQCIVYIEKQKKYLIINLLLIGIAILSIVFLIKITKSIRKRNLVIKNTNTELSKSQSLLKKSLLEKEILLKEIHHRVKNNLQLVMSLLNIQARESDSKDLYQFFEKGRSRIVSMALIHENIYKTNQLNNVNFQDYIDNLTKNIKTTLNISNDNIITEVLANNFNFDIETSISLGLIINELYSYSLKYAFPKKEGKIVIELNQKNADNFQLSISDNGAALQEKTSNKKTLGLELVYLLVDQLSGKITLNKNQGTKYVIDFKPTTI